MMAGLQRGDAGVCIVGSGPAGSTLATRLAQLGHDVCLIERAAFPRSRLGESLSPGVLSLLESTGVRHTVEAAGFRRVRKVHVNWDRGLEERLDPAERGLLVDRGHFDRLLLERARAVGVRVLQPATVRETRWRESGWSLLVDTDGRRVEIRAAFLADARGRSDGRRARQRIDGKRTLALYAYWNGTNLPDQPRIEAGPDEWYWGVPLPDGTYNTLVFVDLDQYRAAPSAALVDRFRALIARSGLLDGSRNAQLAGPVRTTEATPYLAPESVTAQSIKVGDAALAIDPLSSSGVQKAVQTALAAAVVVNTLLRRPESRDAALRFYGTSLENAATRHRGWAADHYATVAAHGRGSFWHDRAAARPVPLAPAVARAEPQPSSEGSVELSPEIEFVELPCLDGDFVTVKPAISHPGLDDPLAYLGGFELAPLLRTVKAGMTPLDVVHAWSTHVPLPAGSKMVGWLLNKGVLVPRTRY